MDNIIELRNITKRFGNLVANDDITIDIKRAQVHSIIGENGAGKSTLMNMISGLIVPDEGQLVIDGKICNFKNSKEANEAGVGMVHQEFMLFHDMTVIENIILGYEKTAGMFLDMEAGKRAVREICDKYNFDIPLEAKVKDLPISLKQQVEIVKVLYRGAEIIILDEPTAVLTPQGIEGLFEAIKFLVNNGKTIIFITHKLKEVLRISNSITVLKDGKVTGTVYPEDVDEYKLASLMVGREVFLKVDKPDKKLAENAVEIKNLSVVNDDGIEKVKDISLDIGKGEILGIAGVANNGQKELVETIFGLRKAQKGKILYKNQDITNKNPTQLRKMGIGYVPQDRINIGSNSKAPMWENAVMGYHITKGFKSKVLFDHSKAFGFTESIRDRFNVKMPSIYSPAKTLSGGNLQKLIIGREFSQDFQLLIIEDPTRGVDIGAMEFIWKEILEIAKDGAAILLVSHDLTEIMSLSDRIAVLYDGEITGILKASEAKENEIGLLMTGGKVKQNA